MKELLWGTKPEPREPEPEPAWLRGYDPFQPVKPSGALDLRAFIELLSRARHLTSVKERVDWQHGIGRWTRSRHKPLLFENIKDYPGQRIFTNGLNDQLCIAMALGFDPGLPAERVLSQLRKRLREPIHPKLVSMSPVMENVVPASMLDLLQFPVPQWSQYESGRYIGTWHLNVSRDPQTGRRSAGVYRMKVLGPKQATVNASKRSELARQLAKAEEKKTELPVAVVIGAPEAIVIAATAVRPAGMDAFELAGALQKKPVELIECGHLEVPAHSEILIEGFLHPGVRVEDGPYPDHNGRLVTNPKAFLFEARRMMHRDDPIFRGRAIGKTGIEEQQLRVFLAELNLLESPRSRFSQMVHTIFG